jgi:hypothetical protein
MSHTLIQSHSCLCVRFTNRQQSLIQPSPFAPSSPWSSRWRPCIGHTRAASAAPCRSSRKAWHCSRALPPSPPSCHLGEEHPGRWHVSFCFCLWSFTKNVALTYALDRWLTLPASAVSRCPCAAAAAAEAAVSTQRKSVSTQTSHGFKRGESVCTKGRQTARLLKPRAPSHSLTQQHTCQRISSALFVPRNPHYTLAHTHLARRAESIERVFASPRA